MWGASALVPLGSEVSGFSFCLIVFSHNTDFVRRARSHSLPYSFALIL